MKRLILSFAVVLSILLLGQGAEPAAPDVTYTLRAWTVDGGGISFAIGSGYSLGSAAGQPDAAASRAGGSYTLRGGFWEPACLPAGVPVTIARSDNDVVLSWPHSTANQIYYVHRGTTSYFTPSLATRWGAVSAAPWDFTDVDVLGDVDTHYTYLVRPACGAAYVDTSRQAEFEFSLTPGS